MRENSTVDGIKEYTLDSWAEFFALTKDSFSTAPAFVFRGQANYEWSLLSSLDRHELRFSKRKNLVGKIPEFFDAPPLTDEEHLNAFKRAVRGRRGPNPQTLTADEWWALGQHHGLATPLLDFTRSPFVALFFAFEQETVLINGKLVEPEFRGVYALSTSSISHPPNQPKDPLPIISPESDANYRLVSQGALFAKMPRRIDLEKYIRGHFAGESRLPSFMKIRIPNNDRHGCLLTLNKMNINHMTLFPDIDGAAKHVNSLWQPGHEDSIAWV